MVFPKCRGNDPNPADCLSGSTPSRIAWSMLRWRDNCIWVDFCYFGALASDLPGWILIPWWVLLGILGGALWAFFACVFQINRVGQWDHHHIVVELDAPKIAGLLVFGLWHSPRETNMTPNFCGRSTATQFLAQGSNWVLLRYGLLMVFCLW